MMLSRVDDRHTNKVSEFYNTTHFLFQIHSLRDNFVGGIYQKKFGDTGKMAYGVFVADK